MYGISNKKKPNGKNKNEQNTYTELRICMFNTACIPATVKVTFTEGNHHITFEVLENFVDNNFNN